MRLHELFARKSDAVLRTPCIRFFCCLAWITSYRLNSSLMLKINAFEMFVKDA